MDIPSLRHKKCCLLDRCTFLRRLVFYRITSRPILDECRKVNLREPISREMSRRSGHKKQKRSSVRILMGFDGILVGIPVLLPRFIQEL